jgi:hypothetical protein
MRDGRIYKAGLDLAITRGWLVLQERQVRPVHAGGRRAVRLGLIWQSLL